MPWDPDSARRARLPANWQSIRLRVLRKAHYICEHRDTNGVRDCAAPANQADHINPGDDHSEGNLRALCQSCHSAKSSREGVEARERRGYTARRPSQHPGAISKKNSLC